MKKRKIIVACLILVFLVGCARSGKENFELGTLEIVDHGPVALNTWQTQIVVDTAGKITSVQYSVESGTITGPTYSWEYQMSPAERSQVEQECRDADILYRGDVTLPDGAAACIGAGNLEFHAVSKSGQENRFMVSGAVRCVPPDLIPAAINTLYTTITGWGTAGAN